MTYETLENRRLLAVAPWSIHVNFQTPEATSAPAGYRAAVGATFGRRPNGATYGFSSSMVGQAVNRNDPRSPDERYDAFNVLRDDVTWQVAVPESGTYRVRVVAGDPKVFNSAIRISAEHVIVTEGTTSSERPWFDGTTTVSVTDGALTVASAPGAVNNKLCFIEVTRIEPPAAAPAPASATLARPISITSNAISWSDNSDNETGFKIERKRGSLGQFEPVAVVGANVTSFVDTPLRAGASYWYRVRSFNAAGGAAASRQDWARTFDSSGTLTWEQLTPSPIERAEALTATIDNKLHVFGGFNGSNGPVVRSDVYDPITNAWTRLPDMPRRLTHAGVAVDGRSIYFAGGYIGTGSGFEQQFGTEEVWRYHVDLQEWSRLPDLPAALASGGLVVLGRELHYFGGNDANREDVGVHYVLNLDEPASWSSAAALPSPRSHMGYVALDGRIYALGGQFGNDAALETTNLVHVWDPASPSAWQARASMPSSISHMSSSTFVLHDRIVIAGGETGHDEPTRSVLAYDPLANSWESLTDLPSARFSGAARAIEGVLYFTGGSNTTTTYRGVFSG